MAASCRLLALGALLLALVAPAAAEELGRRVDYLYIEANEGGSSGGHVALGLGDEVFHFEHRSPGILVLGVDDLEHFRYRYGVRENRTIHVSRIPVSEETYGLIVDRFRHRHFLQARHLDVMDGLERDRVTLEQMRAGALVIEAAGLFVAPEGTGVDPDLAALRSRVRAVYGEDVLDRRIEQLHSRLAELDPAALDLPEPPSTELPPVPTYSFPQRYRDLVTAVAALEILRDARPLAPGVLVPSLAFREADAVVAERLSDALSKALVRRAPRRHGEARRPRGEPAAKPVDRRRRLPRGRGHRGLRGRRRGRADGEHHRRPRAYPRAAHLPERRRGVSRGRVCLLRGGRKSPRRALPGPRGAARAADPRRFPRALAPRPARRRSDGPQRARPRLGGGAGAAGSVCRRIQAALGLQPRHPQLRLRDLQRDRRGLPGGCPGVTGPSRGPYRHGRLPQLHPRRLRGLRDERLSGGGARRGSVVSNVAEGADVRAGEPCRRLPA